MKDPTGKFRWLIRDDIPILQQEFIIDMEHNTEWIDVPIEYEE